VTGQVDLVWCQNTDGWNSVLFCDSADSVLSFLVLKLRPMKTGERVRFQILSDLSVFSVICVKE